MLVNKSSGLLGPLALFGALYGVFKVLSLVTKFGPLGKIASFCSGMVMFNYPIRYMMEGMLDLCISGVLSVRSLFNQ